MSILSDYSLDVNLKRTLFSDDDILWEHVKQLNINNKVSELELKNLYYYYFDNIKKFCINTTDKKYKLNINDIIEPLSNIYFTLHRGTNSFNYSILNKIKNNDKKLFILGNGPSLGKVMNDPKKLQVLRDNHTFGLNAAYRAYEKYNFYPTYFGCFDYIVNNSHKSNFENLVLTDNPIQQFFFIGDSNNKQNLYSNDTINNKRFVNLNFITRTPDEKKRNDIIAYDYNHFTDMLTSGTNSVQIGIIKGYKEIILLGCDCNYVEIVDGAECIDNKGKVQINNNVNENPNYWFNEYQQKGDQFNIPNTTGCQLPAWHRLNNTIKELNLNVNITNVNDNSNIKCFKSYTYDEYFNTF